MFSKLFCILFSLEEWTFFFFSHSCLRCCNISVETPSCLTKLCVCSKIQVRLGVSECAHSCALQHSEDKQSAPLNVLLQFVLGSALFSQSLSSLFPSVFSSAGTTWRRSMSWMESSKSPTWGCGVTDSRRLSTYSSHWPTASRRWLILLINVKLLSWSWHQESKALKI